MSKHHVKARWEKITYKLRPRWAAMIRAAEKKGEPIICPKCKKPILSRSEWDIGHQVALAEGGNAWDLDNTYPEHSVCNRSEGGRLGNELVRQRKARYRKW